MKRWYVREKTRLTIFEAEDTSKEPRDTGLCVILVGSACALTLTHMALPPDLDHWHDLEDYLSASYPDAEEIGELTL